MTILNQADTTNLITSIKTRGATLQADIHQAAYSTLAHIRDHGDYTGAVNLMNALPNGQRVKGLALWYSHFSKKKFTVRQDKKAGNIWVGSVAKDRKPEDFLVDEAMQITFADFTVESTPKEITVDKIKKFLTGLIENETMLANGEPQVNPEAVAMASRLLAEFEYAA